MMEFRNVSKNYLKEVYIMRSISLVLMSFVFLVCFFIPAELEEEIIGKTIFLIVWGMFVLWLAVYTIVFPKLQYNRLKYRINDLRIEKQSGVIFLRQQFVPFVRIQHAEIYRGILDRAFKMSTILIYTAGSCVKIQNLNVEDAEELVSHIKKLLDNEARGDVND